MLVVVYPNTDSSDPYNPESAYYENLIMHSPVKLQGVGPGGAYADGTDVAGTVIDGSAYQADAQWGTDWFALANSLAFDGNQNIYEGETLMVVANDGGAGSGTTRVDQFRSNFPASIDGLEDHGRQARRLPEQPRPGHGRAQRPDGHRRDAGRRHLRQRPGPLPADHERRDPGQQRRLRRRHPARHPEIGSNQNDNIRIAFNRIDQNGGTNLAGAVGIFAGATNYRIDHNTLCGNNSAEYGGAISHFGLSNGGKIDHNRIWFNRSYDEGGAVFVGSELPVNPNTMPVGAGAVDIPENVMQANLANDDGGAIRLLMVDGRRRSQTGEGAPGHDPPVRRPHQHPQQHDREQRLDPRGRRHRARRLDQRRGRQQHGRPQHHDRHRHDEHRRAGARRALDGRQQLPAAGRAGQALRGQLPAALLQADALQQRRSPTTAPARGRSRRASTASARTATPSPINLWDIGLADNLCAGRATPAAASRR